jgi:cytidylate kinase
MGALAGRIRIGLRAATAELDGRDVSAEIRTPEVTDGAARASVHPGVRAVLVEIQRQMIDSGRYVAEGRDIGTVVSPDSPLKVFLTASEEERARRRAAQTGESVEKVIAAQRSRDSSDENRAHGELRQAEDAVRIDTTGLSQEEVVARVVELARERGLA